MTLIIRPAAPEDCGSIQLLKASLRGVQNPDNYCSNLRTEWLIENSALSLVAQDGDSGDVHGFMSLYSDATHRDSSPADDVPDEKSEWLNIELETRNFNLGRTYFVKVVFVRPTCAEEVMKRLVHGAYKCLLQMDSIVWALPCKLSETDMAWALSSMKHVCSSDIESVVVYAASREEHLPHLLVRRAVVDDHDDLLPVLQRGTQRYPAFGQLPPSVDPQSEFALARVIDRQDDQNLVLVAEADGKMVGMLVCTAEVEVSPLHRAFDLNAYDNLLRPELYEAQLSNVRGHVLGKKRNVAEAKRQERIDSRNETRAKENEERRILREDFIRQYEAEYAEKVAAEEEAAKALAKKKGKRAPKMEPMPKEPPPPKIPEEMQDLGPDETVEPEVHVDATEEEVRAAMLASETPLEPMATVDEQLCFLAEVYCLDENWESLWQDLLSEAFDFFTSKDYCMVTLPHSSKVPAMLRDFTRIPTMPNAKYPDQLYIFHRYGLLPGMEVRLATAEDHEGIEALTAGMSNQPEILESFKSTVEKESSIVALIDDQIVAVATFIVGVNLELLQSNFLLGSRIQMNEIGKESLAEVDMVVINPIFAHRQHDLLVNCLGILNSSVLFYALPPETEKPDVLTEFCQIPGRAGSSEEDGFALYCFSYRLSHVRRQIINSQVVIIGASECGISTVEHLLCNPELEFTSITLVVPGGITVGGAGSSYSSQDLSKIGLEAQVSVIDGEMVGLDREEKLVILSDQTVIDYEVLVLTAGLQDQSLKKISRGAPLDAPVVTLEELVSELEEPFAQSLTSCIVYGATMEAYQAMEVLAARGCDMQHVTHIIPPEMHVGPSLIVPKVAKHIGLELPDTEIMALVNLQGIEDGSLVDATFAYVNPETMENITVSRTTQLLVMTDAKDVDISLFECINGASLVYDGRVVVNGAFQTNDPSIYAAGTIARFTRNLATDVYQEYYNSKEIGCRLAESLCGHFGGVPTSNGPEEMPNLGMARVVGTDLPGGGSIIYVGTPAAIAHPSLEPVLDGRKIFTKTDKGYTQLVLDENQVVQSLTYAGPLPVTGSKYQGIVGISVSYLNDILIKYESSLIPDLLDFLNEPWAHFYQHDGFFTLRNALLKNAAPLFDPQGNNRKIKSMTLDVVMSFVRSHLAELPGLNLPQGMTGGSPSS